MRKKVTRRQFVRTGTAATAAAALTGARRQDTPPLRIGLIGCGGRGTGAVENCLESSKNVTLVAMADMFDNRLRASRKQLSRLEGYDVPDANCFTGFDAYKQLIASGVDVVLMATPPGFRPIHFAAAIDAGKHVFFEKPVAVDPVGIRKVIEWGEKAKKKGLALVAGSQNRHDRGMRELMRRIHDGQIGRVMAIRSYRNSGPIWSRPRRPVDDFPAIGRNSLLYPISTIIHQMVFRQGNRETGHRLGFVALGSLPEQTKHNQSQERNAEQYPGKACSSRRF